MNQEYIEANDRMHQRTCDIASALSKDTGVEASGPSGDFCRYFTSLQYAQWIRLLNMMDGDKEVTKKDMKDVMSNILAHALDNECASKNWAGYMDLQYEGHMEPDDFVRNQQHHDA